MFGKLLFAGIGGKGRVLAVGAGCGGQASGYSILEPEEKFLGIPLVGILQSIPVRCLSGLNSNPERL